MPWVPIADSGVAFDFTSNTFASMVGSTVSGDATGSSSGVGWEISFPGEAVQPRVTIQSYFSPDPFSEGPSSFSFNGSDVVENEITGEATEFLPNPVNPGIPVSVFGYNSGAGPETYRPDVFVMLVEVWVESVEISYNCECDDPNPSRTLSELRAELMRRLGFSAMTASPPPGMPELLNSFLQGAQRQLYRTYRVLRTERFYTWQLLQGVRYYDLDANEDVCTKKLDPRMITWVGISDNTDWWQPLICGIPPECYSWNQTQGWPQRYEIRQCIEVWPAPDGNENWKLRIKGHFGLEPFEADDDQCTIDDEAVFLFALARAKAHYTQPDAANYQTDAMNYIKNLTAGAHMTRRYVPGTVESASPVPPKFIPKNY